MAKKARFFELTCRNGHEDIINFFPAASEASLKNELEPKLPSALKIIKIEYLGYFPVAVLLDEDDGLRFSIACENEIDLYFFKNNFGFDYLSLLFSKKIKELVDIEKQKNRFVG